MGSLADAAGKFAEKFADVLDVFDLSFFVAGSAAFGACLVWLTQAGVAVPDDFSTDRALVAIIIAYVLGLVCFAAGRAAREFAEGVLSGRDDVHPLAKLYAEHRLQQVADFGEYDGRWSALYGRLWVLVRTERRLRETFALVRRYWILGAAYDGLAVAALLWIPPAWGLESTLQMRLILITGLLIAVVVSWRQAAQYSRIQVVELAATAGHWHGIASRQRTDDDAEAPEDG